MSRQDGPGRAPFTWRARMRERIAIALYGLAQRASGGVCLCAYCLAFAKGQESRAAWRRYYREGWRTVQRYRSR